MNGSFPSRLSPSDSLMWHIERDPVLRSPVVAVGMLDREPEWSAVRATFERAVERVPRFRQRVESSPWTGLRWVDDPHFSLDYHLRRVRAPHPADIRSVLDIATPFATSALDPARPLWECTIVDGVDGFVGQRAAFILKFHHTMTDGVGGIDLAGVVFDHHRSGDVPREVTAPLSVPARHPLHQMLAVAGAGIAAIRDPIGTSRTLVRLGRSTGRMLAPVPAPMSPLFTCRGLDRHLDVFDVPLESLRAAASEAGVTINAVFLAAVGGAMHDFHQRLGSPVGAIRVTMPVNVRAEGDPMAGNRFVPVRFVLPIDDPDPRARAHIAAAIAGASQHEPAMKVTDGLAAILDRVPEPLVTRLFGSMLKNVDLDAVDLKGLTQPMYLGGSRIDRLWAFAPPTGAAVSVTLLSHLDSGCVGIVTDLAAVPEPDVLTTCLERSFDEMFSIVAERRAS